MIDDDDDVSEVSPTLILVTSTPSTSYTPSSSYAPPASPSSSTSTSTFPPLSQENEQAESIKKLPKWYLQVMTNAPSPPADPKRQSKLRHTTNFALIAQVLNVSEPSTFEDAFKDQI